MINAAKDIIEMVDVHGWTLARAKSAFAKRTGVQIKARSKDELVSKLAAMAK